MRCFRDFWRLAAVLALAVTVLAGCSAKGTDATGQNAAGQGSTAQDANGAGSDGQGSNAADDADVPAGGDVSPEDAGENASSFDPGKLRVGGTVPTEFENYGEIPEEPEYEERDMTISDSPFLKADGKILRDDFGNGDLVQLKGTNVGGFLLQEFWMTATDYSTNVTAENDVYRVLTERFGAEDARELIALYQDSFFTEDDFDFCRELGMNCLRLPMWYRNLVDENGEFYDNCWDRIDWFVEQAGNRGIYVILDMHGAPGSQNGSDHSGLDGKDDKMGASEFFFGDEETVKANQELFYRIWEAIAEHYNGNPWVAGYDLLNEPYCTYRYNTGLTDKVLRETLWDIYDEAYRRIRDIDPDHVIIMEATWDPVDLPKPDRYGWENVMYQYHNYLYSDYNNAQGKQVSNMKKKLTDISRFNYNVPSYLGEFALFDNKDAWDEGVKLINESGVSWTTWTYKVITSDGNWGLKHIRTAGLNLETADRDKIVSVWSKGGDTLDNTTLINVLKKYYKQEFIGVE